MITKLFPHDKNYILREAQNSLEDMLLYWMVEFVKERYQIQNNPLGLVDDTILKIRKTKKYSLEQLEEFYSEIAAIYRYKNADNQLELLFDGTTHEERFRKDWEAAFKRWSNEFGQNPNFLRAVLEATIFFPKDRKAHLAGNRMKALTSQYFEMKVYKNKGLRRLKTA